MFSMILRSGLILGQSIASTAVRWRYSWGKGSVCGVAPSCIYMGLSMRRWLSIWCSKWGAKISSTYLWAFKFPLISTRSSLHLHTVTDTRPDANVGTMLSCWKRSPIWRQTRNLQLRFISWKLQSSVQCTRRQSARQHPCFPWAHMKCTCK